MGTYRRTMSTIAEIKGREIIDSRGIPTVEVDVILEDGTCGRACVPSGASTGTHEAIEKRDRDPHRYHGRGVLSAIQGIDQEIAPALKGWDVREQQQIDRTLIGLDGTPNKSRLGANALLGVSLAVAQAAAKWARLPLYRTVLGAGLWPPSMPTPLMNLINGGKHADNALDIQEFMIVPTGAPSFKEALRWGTEVYHTLKNLLKQRGLSTNVGDEGGFAPQLRTTVEALDWLCQAIEHSGLRLGTDITLALDIAANELYQDGLYHLEGRTGNAGVLIEFYTSLCAQYPILSLEDGLNEDDWDGWSQLTEILGHRVQLVGDDLFVTCPQRLAQGISRKAGNAILVKLNQIGTLTEALDATQLAKDSGYQTILSHRSGETEDTSIADLAIAWACGQIKTGAPSRCDRTAKYNQLLRLEEDLLT